MRRVNYIRIEHYAQGIFILTAALGQGFKDMSPPTKELMKLVLEKRIAHGGHPVLR